jgi:hypothetical protein
MAALKTYLKGVSRIHAVGEAVEETSYYGQLEALLNEVGDSLTPKVMCVLTTRNQGAGIPDGGLFTRRPAVVQAGTTALLARSPEHGAMEVKGPIGQVRRIARSNQVKRYLERYGQVLVTNYREFLQVRLGSNGEAVLGEEFSLADNPEGFWALADAWRKTPEDLEQGFEEYLRRVLLADAPLSSPADLAWFLARYARTGLSRLEAAGDLERLTVLRRALEDALGLRFEGEDGEHFFRSALVQTLFYGVFAAWVVWSEQHGPESEERFSWKEAQWTLNVPMVRVLFSELATPANLPVNLDEVLDWTEEALNRVDRKLFFERFEPRAAVPYFYEPFLQEYDPELRRQLGVWYTPPEVVRYMVEHVHRALQDHLDLPLGLADENVHILDPATGTGSFLTEALRRIAATLEEQHGNGLVAQQTKQAALSRVHGFELLPAPFVVAHLQVGLALDQLGAPLDASAGERARVYLTNSLTGWGVQEEDQPQLPFPEFEEERDAADSVKQTTPILVVIGNPPYNGFAGVSGAEEGGLVDPYKEGLAADWDITKNKLDDLYIRFFRVAERRITEQTGKGIVCFISNFGWLGDPSAVVMRQRLAREFDVIEIDNLNGDSRETGKKTPEGEPDPSIFSTKLNPAGIQVGTAVSMLVRQGQHQDDALAARYRDYWGADKPEQLDQAVDQPDPGPPWQVLEPGTENWYRLRPWEPRDGYEDWPAVTDLSAKDPMLGLNENRGEALIDHDQEALVARIKAYLNPEIRFGDLPVSTERLQRTWSGFDPPNVRRCLLESSPFDKEKIVRFQIRPLDLRWAYVDTAARLWNRSRPELVAAAELDSGFLLVRRRSPRSLDGAALMFSSCLIDQHVMHKDAYTIPLCLAVTDEGPERLFGDEGEEVESGRPNLSGDALEYLTDVGVEDVATSQTQSSLLWLHVLAVGYSPLYLEENGDAIRNDWPRFPLPADRETLLQSAELGSRVAALLDLRHPVSGLDSSVKPQLRKIASIAKISGGTVDAADLTINVGWGVEQRRQQESGAVSRLVMPGSGRVEARDRDQAELAELSENAIELLGPEVLDVFLNPETFWSNVPEAAWDYKIGGFQVLRKWLSYRDEVILGRALRIDEARQFTSICRRLTELVLLGSELDANYLATTGSVQQDPLVEVAGASSG